MKRYTEIIGRYEIEKRYGIGGYEIEKRYDIDGYVIEKRYGIGRYDLTRLKKRVLCLESHV